MRAYVFCLWFVDWTCSVKHLLVQTKADLQIALWKSQQEQTDCVIEVQSCIADNANFHRFYHSELSIYFNEWLCSYTVLTCFHRFISELYVCLLVKQQLKHLASFWIFQILNMSNVYLLPRSIKWNICYIGKSLSFYLYLHSLLLFLQFLSISL